MHTILPYILLLAAIVVAIFVIKKVASCFIRLVVVLAVALLALYLYYASH